MRRFTPEDRGLIEYLLENATSIQAVITSLARITSNYDVNKKGVYNYADCLRHEKLNGLNEVVMLLKYLRDDEDATLASKSVQFDTPFNAIHNSVLQKYWSPQLYTIRSLLSWAIYLCSLFGVWQCTIDTMNKQN